MIRPCQICGCFETEKLFSQKFYNNVISPVTSYDVVKCKTCGFIFANNMPEQEYFNAYYENMSKWEFNYFSGDMPDQYYKHAHKTLNFINKWVTNKEAKILDVGCSTGALLAVMKQSGFKNLVGLDPSLECVNKVKRIPGIDAIKGTISSINVTTKFDLITIASVLEHIADLKEALLKITWLLNDGGYIFVEVPDLNRFHEQVFTPFQQFSIEHINYFTPTSITNALGSVGFKVIDIVDVQNETSQHTDPSIFLIGKLDNLKKSVIIDECGSDSVNRYIQISEELDKALATKLEKLPETVIIWGVGTSTQRLLASGKLDTSKILYFVDSNKNYVGLTLANKKIKDPTEIIEDVPILVATWSYKDEIISMIKTKLNLSNRIISLYD